MWRELLQLYAVQAREFSDTVARLGQHEHAEIGRDALTLIKKSKDAKHCAVRLVMILTGTSSRPPMTLGRTAYARGGIGRYLRRRKTKTLAGYSTGKRL